MVLFFVRLFGFVTMVSGVAMLPESSAGIVVAIAGFVCFLTSASVSWLRLAAGLVAAIAAIWLACGAAAVTDVSALLVAAAAVLLCKRQKENR